MEVGDVTMTLGLAGALVLLFYLLPVKKVAPWSSNSAPELAARIQRLEARNTEAQAQYDRLMAEYQRKLVEYTEAYGSWMRREAEYKERIGTLEDEVQNLRRRIRELEARAGVPAQSKLAPADDLNVIGIWPDRTLNIAAEAAALHEAGYEYYPIYGEDATRTKIIREVWRHEKNGRLILEIGAHGQDEGVVLAGGDVATPRWWSDVFRDVDLEMAMLLFCDSDSVGDALYGAGVPIIVSTRAAIEDADAAVFAREVYACLARGDDVADAIARAKLHLTREAGEAIRVRGA